ncbi:hypothetical protein ACLK19_04310 [Escherichia coli]
MRFISAVMGGRTFKGREAESKNLLTWGFGFFAAVNPLKVGKSSPLNRFGLVIPIALR